MADSSGAKERRSAFVTAVAWVFIVLAGFSTLISIMQNIMLSIMFSTEEFGALTREAGHAQEMPAVFRFMFANFRYFFLGFLLVSATTLVSAIGLLMRKNWARWLFVGIMGLGIVWNLGSLAMPFVMSSVMDQMPAPAPSDFQDNFRVIWNIMMFISIVICLALAVLFGWIIKRLVSQDIRTEFVAI
jgi:hypothetical protein